MLKNTIPIAIIFLISACVHVKQESEITGIAVGDTLRLKSDAFIVRCNVHESTITAWFGSGEYKNDKCLMNKTFASFGHTIIGKIEAPKSAKVAKIIEHAMLGNYTSYTFIKVTGSRATYIVSHHDLDRLFESDIKRP
jgi:hypothetical protein